MTGATRGPVYWIPVIFVVVFSAGWLLNRGDYKEVPPERAVSYTDFANWPLYTQGGTLKCWSGNAITLTTSGGMTYAINGRARERLESDSWHDAFEVKLPDRSLDPLIEEGLKICR